MMPHMQKQLITILDDSLEAISNQGRTVDECLALHPSYRTELAPLLHLAARLHAAHSLAPSTEFRTASVNRLRGQLKPRSPGFSRNGKQDRTRTALTTRRLNLSPLLVGLLLTIFLALSSGIWFASAQALPGDTFYPMKSYAEKFQLVVISNEANRANLRLDFATRRLRESQALLDQNRDDLLGQAMNDYAKQMDEESNLLDAGSPLSMSDQIALANRLLTSLPQHQSALAGILEDVAPKDRESIQNASRIAQKVLQRAVFLAGRQPGEIPPIPVPSATPTLAPVQITPRPTPQPEATPRPTRPVVLTPAPGSLPTKIHQTRTAIPPHPTRTPPSKTPVYCILGTAPSNSALPTCWPTKMPSKTSQPTPQPGGNATATPRPTKLATRTPRAIFPPLATLHATRTAHPTYSPWPWKTP
jgi:hypothetical protein